MRFNRFDPENIQLHESADALIRRYVLEFSETIVIEAQLSAHRKNENVVLLGDVENAKKITYMGGFAQNRIRDFFSVISSVFLGAGLSGFLVELGKSTPEKSWLLIFFTLVLMGGLSVVWIVK